MIIHKIKSIEMFEVCRKNYKKLEAHVHSIFVLEMPDEFISSFEGLVDLRGN